MKVRTATTADPELLKVYVTCGPWDYAIGGGGYSEDARDRMIGSYPADWDGEPVEHGTINPPAWAVEWDQGNGMRHAYVVCVQVE